MDLVKVFTNWDVLTQATAVVVLGIVCCVTVYHIVETIVYNIRIILRGYSNKPEKGTAQLECNHDNNLTGLCLKVPHCKTVNECDKTVDGN